MFSISIKNDTSFFIQSFYACWMFLAVLFWDIFIVYLVTNKKSRIFMEKYSNFIEKFSGIILFIIGITIIFNTI
jgi:threonine/homoserine/homoserine lactone efflux protein